ncbi:MAG: enoyl-CoA hydratase-related protein [Rhodocyclaceae bacterium]
MPEGIRIERTAELATVILDNRERLNAIDAAMWRGLADAMHALSSDAQLRCVIVRGAGDRAFAAGGDIEEFLRLRSNLEQALVYHQQWVAGALAAVRECVHPTLAMIHGACIGGGLEIASQCDLRICAASARFGAPIGRLGFTMAPAELAGVLDLAGPAVALELLLEGRLFDAQEAFAKGLVGRVVADDELEQEALATAKRIAAGAPLAARAHKRLVRRLASRPLALAPAQIAESFALLETEDYREGIAAFLEKRAPRFVGR